MSSPGARGGWSTSILTKNLMTDPGREISLREGLLSGIAGAQEHIQNPGSTEFRNFRRSHRLERCRGVVKT